MLTTMTYMLVIFLHIESEVTTPAPTRPTETTPHYNPTTPHYFSTTSPPVQCGGSVSSGEDIISPNYPSQYPAYLLCEWNINAPAGQVYLSGYILYNNITLLLTFI